ncbi:MAG: DUF4105 domain-containing protein [Saccharospirillaceae bacterium]|nr:DUF4105 domain-containing protein [Pseudomonadales bacterium]NRB78680.1 DUF4105 domain-containing protein [Saccharospirillaceae bacterium]
MWIFLVIVICLIFFSIIYFKKPLQNKNWTAIHKKTAQITFDNNIINIQNIKDFTYMDNGQINKAHYFNDSFDITQVKTVWYGLAHFSKFGIAHAFLSFEFENGQFLVTSIEARRLSKQKFSPFKGMFNQYNKIIVFGTERDIIGLRTHYLKHKVYLYALEMDKSETQSLFESVLKDALKLQKQPEFYNTLLDNCLTGIAKFSKQWNKLRYTFDYRVFLPGFSDVLVQKMGFLNTDISIKNIRAKALLNPVGSHPEDHDFSKKIRKNYNI